MLAGQYHGPGAPDGAPPARSRVDHGVSRVRGRTRDLTTLYGTDSGRTRGDRTVRKPGVSRSGAARLPAPGRGGGQHGPGLAIAAAAGGRRDPGPRTLGRLAIGVGRLGRLALLAEPGDRLGRLVQLLLGALARRFALGNGRSLLVVGKRSVCRRGTLAATVLAGAGLARVAKPRVGPIRPRPGSRDTHSHAPQPGQRRPACPAVGAERRGGVGFVSAGGHGDG